MNDYLKSINQQIKDRINEPVPFKTFLNDYNNYEVSIKNILECLGYRKTHHASVKQVSLKVLEGFNSYGPKSNQYHTPYFAYYYHPSRVCKDLQAKFKKYEKMTIKEIRELLELKHTKMFKFKKISCNEFLLRKLPDDFTSYSKLLKFHFGTDHKQIGEFVELAYIFEPHEDNVFHAVYAEREINDSILSLSNIKEFFMKDHKLNHNDFYKFLESVINPNIHFYKTNTRSLSKENVYRFYELINRKFNIDDFRTLAIKSQDINDIIQMLPDENTREYELLTRRLKQILKDQTSIYEIIDKLHNYQIGKLNRSKTTKNDHIEYEDKLKLKDDNLRFISSPKEQREHGKAMRHCIGSAHYINNCIKGTHSIYEYEDKKNKSSKFYTFFINNKSKRIAQTKAKFNESTPTNIINKVKKLLKEK